MLQRKKKYADYLLSIQEKKRQEEIEVLERQVKEKARKDKLKAKIGLDNVSSKWKQAKGVADEEDSF